ncbi:MAG: hypothetical protein LBU20_00720 [Candidatus Nomurabacteria bacterium]|jgi:hypothetical protein|nr:hypothetical protein [Candidatus Nomurabacteria bacterium]
MGIIVNDKSGRSQLQERLAAELKEKLARAGSDEADKLAANLQKTPDMVSESAYVKDFQKKPAGENGRVAAIIIAAVAVLAIFGLVLTLSL